MAASIQNATSNEMSEIIDELRNLDEINRAISVLEKKEEMVAKELDELLEHQSSLESKMLGLHKMLPNLQLLQTDAKQLTGMISFTSTLAENVSGKVRQLDLAKKHVVSCMQRVEDILDLKFCTDGVQSALLNEEYETAAGHIHRFRSLDENILRMSADASEGSTLETSFTLLRESEDKLRAIVHNKFDAAVHTGDVASVERFFKIFPLLGLHDDGLAKFGKYLASQMADTADKNFKLSMAIDAEDKRAKVVYADAMTMLFESTARVVEIHQPLIETYYGPGKLFSLLRILQRECDRQARKILGHFKEQRFFDKRVEQIRQCLMFSKNPATNPIQVDTMELDVLLAEVVLLNTRTELYLRFMKRRSLSDLEVAYPEKDVRIDMDAEVLTFFSSCDLSRLLQELIGTYIMMEEYFMREMVNKAVNLNSSPDDVTNASNMVDDIFFIVNKCIRRALSSSSVDGLCAMLNHSCSILEQDFREVLLSVFRTGYPSGFDLSQAYNLVQSSIQQGKLQTSDSDKTRNTFLITLNNASTSCDYIKKLKLNLEEEVSRFHGQSNDQSMAKLESCLTDLGAVSSRFKDALDFGFSQLVATAIKPRVKPLTDMFLSTNHNITEEDFSNYEANDPWVQGVILSIDASLKSFKESLSTDNYESFISHMCTEIVVQLEKAVTKSAYNRLGGLQFDKELRALVAYLTSVTTWTVRDKFARLTQMATILNLEHVTEILDYWGSNSGPLTWRLTPNEVRQILSLRVDFHSDDVRRLKL